MIQNKTLFSPSDYAELKKRLDNIRRVCYPASKLTAPSFIFKKKEDFDPTDALNYGDINDGYPIFPSELKDIWQDRETLRDNHVDYIITKGKKWYYNTQMIIGDFYSKDGHKKVEIQFPYWMDAENMWKQPGVLDAVGRVLEKCSGRSFPTQKEALACFDKKLLRQIYEKNPSRASIEQYVLEMMETLRKKIAEFLHQNHVSDILKEQAYQTYAQNASFAPNTPDAQKVKQYLAQNLQALYLLGEKFGLIKNASRIIRYEQMRDHVRHPDKIKPLLIEPYTIYKDFATCLGQTIKGPSRAKTLRHFAENSDIVQHLEDMSQIWKILDQHVDPKLVKKKNKPDYYQDLIQKQMLTEKEAKILRRRRMSTNEVAHLNHRVKRARQKVMNDTKLQTLAIDLYDRHMEKISRWIEEKSHTF